MALDGCEFPTIAQQLEALKRAGTPLDQVRLWCSERIEAPDVGPVEQSAQWQRWRIRMGAAALCRVMWWVSMEGEAQHDARECRCTVELARYRLVCIELEYGRQHISLAGPVAGGAFSWPVWP